MAGSSQIQSWNQSIKKKTIQRINKTKNWFFDKINPINKPVPKLTKGQRYSIQINKIRKGKGAITTEIQETQKNHDILLQKPILNKTGKCRWNGWFSRQITNTKVKSRAGKLSKQVHIAQGNTSH